MSKARDELVSDDVEHLACLRSGILRNEVQLTTGVFTKTGYLLSWRRTEERPSVLRAKLTILQQKTSDKSGAKIGIKIGTDHGGIRCTSIDVPTDDRAGAGVRVVRVIEDGECQT